MKLAVDTSALIAIIRSEYEAPHMLDLLGIAEQRLLSAATLLEASIVTSGRADEAERLDLLVRRSELEIVPFSQAEAAVGAQAFRKYGKGSGHPAKLNFGDCFAYALARTRNLPLLFKGDEFIHTDIQPALKPA
jgi:ribonuclease VapC